MATKKGRAYRSLTRGQKSALTKYSKEQKAYTDFVQQRAVPRDRASEVQKKVLKEIASKLGFDLVAAGKAFDAAVKQDRKRIKKPKSPPIYQPTFKSKFYIAPEGYLSRTSPLYFINPPKPTGRPAPDFQFWFSHSNVSATHPGLVWTIAKDEFRLKGLIEHHSNTRHTYSATLESFFILQRNRLAGSFWNTWQSKPAVSVAGFAECDTQPWILWYSPDLKYAQLDLAMGHQIFQSVNGDNKMIGSNLENHRIFDCQNGEQGGDQIIFPPGPRFLAPATFRLFDDTLDLLARVAISMVLTLEGDAWIDIGVDRSCLFNTFQWIPCPYDFVNDRVVIP